MVSQARFRDRRVDGLKIHDPAPRAAVADLADIPAQPCTRHRGDRSLRGSNPDVRVPVCISYVTNTMVVHPSMPATSVREFIDHTKANPEKIAYASAGAGTTNHLCGALFEKIAKVSMVHVPYRGGAPAVADTVAGQTQLMFTAGTQSLEHVKAGKLRLLAVTEGKRSSLLPDIPAVGETIPGYAMSVWYGAFGPAGMPQS